MRQFVIGTAGHIDHGKSALVKALTGMDPDRLEEEKRRGMTIDLGFAYLDLPSGRRVGIVDVPGHERLIRTMLAGATGIDLVLLVVASDEGVMPQTREHLDILRFLHPSCGVVVLTKIDLVEDHAWLALVQEEVAQLVEGTFLQGMPVIPVSAKTGEGLDVLIRTIDKLLDEIPLHPQEGPVRLPVDRSFVMPGFGTVVTGTLWSGRIRPGDVLELLPSGKEVRVRGIQSYGQWVEEGIAGTRVALNLAGISREEVQRGDVLVTPQAFTPATLLDVRVELLPQAPPVAHMTRLRFYLGTAEAFGRLALLDREVLGPGESAVGQVRLETPVVAARGDPFVLRRYSPLQTIGGGKVISSALAKRRRGDSCALAEILALERMGEDELAERFTWEAGYRGITMEELSQRLGLALPTVYELIQKMSSAGSAILLGSRIFHSKVLEDLKEAILSALASYHSEAAWRVGMPREELKKRVFRGGDDRLFSHALEDLQREDPLGGLSGEPSQGKVALKGSLVRLEGHRPVRTEVEERCLQHLLRIYAEGRFTPPSKEEAFALLPEDRAVLERMYQAALDEGLLVEVRPGMAFSHQALEEMKIIVLRHIQEHGGITVGNLRDLLATSRRYALAVLEHFDALGLTRRVGDRRIAAHRWLE
ncbi:MAG: selenocysteine-specific translation elongation factor [Armatimonadota bacterium]|nr:selenocysteine-specific translation elongation factor [Armatimonadota bacterium]